MQQDVERETRVAISRWRWWETVGVFLVCTLYIASVLPPMVSAQASDRLASSRSPLLALSMADAPPNQSSRLANSAGAAPRQPAASRQPAAASLPGPGVIATYAGGLSGGGGTPTAYGMTPQGQALDGTGRLIIADAYASLIWLVNLTGSSVVQFGVAVGPESMRIVAGNGVFGYAGDGGAATGAELAGPAGVTLDGAGNLYIADSGNNRVREVLASSGVITTVAGNGAFGYAGDGGPAASAQLAGPAGVTVDGVGNLYIADTYNQRVRKVLADSGVITTVAGNGASGFSGDGGAATSAELAGPSGTAVDGVGNLYIADSGNNRVREVLASSGVITTVAGNGVFGYAGDGGAATGADLASPAGVTLDGAGNLYIADTYNQRVREALASSGVITTVAGNGASGFSGDGGPAANAQLAYLSSIIVDGAGNLYLADTFNNRVREVLAGSGTITTVAGNGASGYGGDGGAATGAELAGPAGVTVDGAGNLYIADSRNQRVREVLTSSGVITTVAGNGAFGYTAVALRRLPHRRKHRVPHQHQHRYLLPHRHQHRRR